MTTGFQPGLWAANRGPNPLGRSTGYRPKSGRAGPATGSGRLWRLGLGAALVCAALSGMTGMAAELSVRVNDDGWTFQSDGLFSSWIDRRQLLVLQHPWAQSASNKAITATREIRVPETWQMPARLHFYMSDDFRSDQDIITEGWLGQIRLVGHRFKQVLVNRAVVWQRDVADANTADQPTRFSVTLPESVRPGDTVGIGFRLHDKVGSGQRLPQDHRHIGATNNLGSDQPWRFQTRVYIGDVMLTPGDVGPVPRCEPRYVARVRSVHKKRWPLPPASERVTFPVTLQVQGSPYGPLHCGCPLPAGAAQSAAQVQLRSADGSPLAIDCRPMNRWPGGSVRWVEISGVLPAGQRAETVQLDVVTAGPPRKPPSHPVTVARTAGGRVILENGAGRIVCAKAGGLLTLRLENGAALLDALTASMDVDGTTYATFVQEVRVLSDGPVRAQVEHVGALRSGADTYGRFVFRVEMFAGLPHAHVAWRIFHDQPGTAQVSRVALTGAFNAGAGRTYCWNTGQTASTAAAQLANVTDAGTTWKLGKRSLGVREGTHADWLGITGDRASLCAFVYRGHEQYPNAIAYDGQQLRICLFEPTDEVPYYAPHEGEAKRFDVWFGLWDRILTHEDLRRETAPWAAPPRLFASDYFCASGGFGHAMPHDEERFPRLTAAVKTMYDNVPERTFHATGLRHWGDLVYQAEAGTWRNGYYDRQQGFAVEYLMTGGEPWFRRLEAAVRHIIDVDVCHHSTEHPSMVGSIHGLEGPDHSTAPPWNPTQRTKGTFAYWRYACDRDARDAALAVADSAADARRGIGATSVRDHAGILYCLTAAYDEARRPKYLEAARRLADDVIKRVDRRRGTYVEIHGNSSYAGNVPWMVAQLMEPLYDYYCQSGDVDAAIILVGLAESILAENTTRGVPGDVYGYSHNPHYKKNSSYHVLIAPAIMYAYELTGDRSFRQHARAMYEQTIRENTVNNISNCYWNTPTLLYYLHKYRAGAEY